MLPSLNHGDIHHNPFSENRFHNRIQGMNAPAGPDGEEDFHGRLARLAAEHRTGNPEAFEALVRETRERIFSMLLRAVKDPGAAEDLLQDTYVRAFGALGGLKDPRACERWLYQIAGNLAKDHLRRRQVERRMLEAVDPVGEIPVADQPPPGDLKDLIFRAVDELPDRHREVFLLREVQGLGHAEIARTLDIPEGTVWSRLSFARKALQEKLRGRMHP